MVFDCIYINSGMYVVRCVVEEGDYQANLALLPEVVLSSLDGVRQQKLAQNQGVPIQWVAMVMLELMGREVSRLDTTINNQNLVSFIKS